MTEDKRKKRIIIIFATTAAALFLLLPALFTAFTEHNFIITDNNSRVFRGKKIFICGDTLILMKGSVEESSRSKLPEIGESTYSLSILSMEEIRIIEKEIPEEESSETLEPVNIRYLGTYRIQLQGHTGVLKLYRGKEKISGTVSFPDWGRGQVEYLKNIRIRGERIYFTRSATTEAEMKRLGANTLFTQKFNGRYSDGGRFIKGDFINHRNERHQWDAEKKK